jgi:hypothetical protein
MIFVAYIKQELKVELVREFRFHPKRLWRFDYAFPPLKIAIEVEGGVWTKGRHTRGSGFVKDMEKYNAAAVLGWTLIRVTPKSLLKRSTVDLIKQSIDNKLKVESYENK